MSELPPKLFFRIGEVAGLVGVEPHVLRYWEREFRSIRPTKSAKGQRVYSRKDVENLLRVRDLLYRDGFTIAGAKKKLLRGEPSPVTASAVGVSLQEPQEHRSLADHDGESETLAPLVTTRGSRVETCQASAPPASTASEHEDAREPTTSTSARVREKLVALRNEVAAFLAELSATSGR